MGEATTDANRIAQSLSDKRHAAPPAGNGKRAHTRHERSSLTLEDGRCGALDHLNIRGGCQHGRKRIARALRQVHGAGEHAGIGVHEGRSRVFVARDYRQRGCHAGHAAGGR